ncbi:MAG: hypothetical protein JJ919_15815 [Henriciella sp.]|nr:hypothetical protein [Henriciella sp.]
MKNADLRIRSEEQGLRQIENGDSLIREVRNPTRTLAMIFGAPPKLKDVMASIEALEIFLNETQSKKPA